MDKKVKDGIFVWHYIKQFLSIMKILLEVPHDKLLGICSQTQGLSKEVETACNLKKEREESLLQVDALCMPGVDGLMGT